jgi:hypothetical protein
MALSLTHPSTEMGTGKLPVDKGWPVCKTDNLIALCDPISYKKWKPPWFDIIA